MQCLLLEIYIYRIGLNIFRTTALDITFAPVGFASSSLDFKSTALDFTSRAIDFRSNAMEFTSPAHDYEKIQLLICRRPQWAPHHSRRIKKVKNNTSLSDN